MVYTIKSYCLLSITQPQVKTVYSGQEMTREKYVLYIADAIEPVRHSAALGEAARKHSAPRNGEQRPSSPGP